MSVTPAGSLISARAVDFVLREGLAEHTAQAVELLAEMAEHGAVVSSRYGNVRYGDFYLNVREGSVLSICRSPRVSGDWCRACLGTELVYDADGHSRACPACT